VYAAAPTASLFSLYPPHSLDVEAIALAGMKHLFHITLLLALLAAGSLSAARAEPRTVCTITVNSSDEKEAFQKRLPRARYRFVELLEKGRDDWMKSSCEMAIPCDVLVISGHFNAGDSFYSDKVEAKEQLNVDELERASCSNSCPALFSRLKEVYLFGCESLNPDASKYSSSHSESGLERMRRIFANVPVIYGFPSSAPLGPTAAALLDRNFDGAALSVGSGHASSRLLRSFSANHMTAVAGVGQSGDGAARRGQICQFFDARLTPAGKLAWVHAMMQRDMGQASAFFERIEHLLASLTDAERLTPAFLSALAEISVDDATRERYLAVERATRSAPLRSRMIALADNLGWLSPEERTTELAGLIGDVLASPSIGFADVDLVCSMGEVPDLNREVLGARVVPSRSRNAAPDAVLACLGDAQARERTLAALTSADDRDVQVAQVYLRHRPVSDAKELRAMARKIARMPGTAAQVRALDTLGRLHVTDREVVEELTRSFAAATSVAVQRAIAEIFLRSGPKAIARPDLASVLREHRLESPNGDDLVEVLIRRLQSPS